MSDCDPDYKDAVSLFYRFELSVAANVVFVVILCISTALHVAQIWRTRTWYLTALAVGDCCEIIGYVGGVLNAREDPGCWTKGPFIIQNSLILIAPALMAASIYMVLGRIILLTEGEVHSIIKRSWLTKLFVFGDVTSLMLQGAGGGLMAGSDSSAKTGQNVIVGGLFVQLFFFGSFVVVSAIFHRRMTKEPIVKATDPRIRWQTYLIALYVASMLIWVRSLFRVIEFIEGNDGHLRRSKVWVFVLDGLLMATVLV